MIYNPQEVPISDAERASAIDRLRASRDKLLAAVAGVTDTQARFQPVPDRWSILQLTEHLAISDDALVALIRRTLATPAAPELMVEAQSKEQRILSGKPFPRCVNKAPEMLRPNARFETLAAAVQAFNESRDRTIAFATETQDPLRSHFAAHPIAGQLDGYQWLVANAIHAETHAAHIEEIKADPRYPAWSDVSERQPIGRNPWGPISLPADYS